MIDLLLQNLGLIIDADGDGKRIRDAILQLAVRGRLVAQEAGDYWVEDSCALGELVEFEIGRTPATKTTAYWATNDGVPWVSISDISTGYPITRTAKRITEKALAQVFRGELVPAGTLLMSFKLSIGKTARLAVDGVHNEAIISIYPGDRIDDSYLELILPIISVGGKTKSAIKGRTLNKKSLQALPIPLPPLAEQHRIVAKVDELMGHAAVVEERHLAASSARVRFRDAALHALAEAEDHEAVSRAWSMIEDHFDELFTEPEDIQPLRQNILQLAVRGRLVAQEAGDEDAQALLDQIEAEKQRLYEAGEIKKSKNSSLEPGVSLEFDLPESWRWSPLGDLAIHLRYGSSAKSSKNGQVPVLRMGNLRDGKIDWTDLKYSSDPEEIDKYRLESPAVLFNRTNSPDLVGKTSIYVEDRPALFAGYLIHVALGSYVLPSFINYLLNTTYARKWCWRVKSDGVSQSNISASKLAGFMVPLPPLAEQHRIVAKVDELMALCDTLETSLARAKTTREQFAASISHALTTPDAVPA